MSTDTQTDWHLDRFVGILEQEHRCHTVILYGSRAIGKQSATSDYDLLGIRRDGDDTRDARSGVSRIRGSACSRSERGGCGEGGGGGD